MSVDKELAAIPMISAYGIDDLQPIDGEPHEQLITELGTKLAHYDFQFYEATVSDVSNERPTSSWVEVAYSRQLGGAQVLWHSGVPGLEIPSLLSYGWLEIEDLTKLDDAIFRESLLMGAPLVGHLLNQESVAWRE